MCDVWKKLQRRRGTSSFQRTLWTQNKIPTRRLKYREGAQNSATKKKPSARIAQESRAFPVGLAQIQLRHCLLQNHRRRVGSSLICRSISLLWHLIRINLPLDRYGGARAGLFLSEAYSTNVQHAGSRYFFFFSYEIASNAWYEYQSCNITVKSCNIMIYQCNTL